MGKEIATFNTHDFMDKYMEPDEQLKGLIRKDYDVFFILPVQELISVSKLPVPPTRSSTHTLIFLSEGVATMKVGAVEHSIGKYECLIVPAGQVFSYNKHEVNKGFICNFSNNFLVSNYDAFEPLKEFEFLNTWGNVCIRPEAYRANNIELTMQRLLDEYLKFGLKNKKLIKAYFGAVLYELNINYTPVFQNRTPAFNALASKFKDLLFVHFKSKHSVSEYAEMLHVSPNHLNKVLKDVTNKSPSKWIEETIIHESKVLLLQTELNINEISSTLGIEDQSYFSRMFKKAEGVSPHVFRKMIEKS